MIPLEYQLIAGFGADEAGNGNPTIDVAGKVRARDVLHRIVA